MTSGSLPAGSRPFQSVATAVFVLVGALVVTSAVGFYPGYFRQFPRFERSGWQVHFHLATVVAWLGMLATQAWLALSGRFEQHRVLGRASYALVPLIVAGFVLVSRFGQERHPEPALIGAALFDGGLFLLFYVLAIANRRDGSIHSRYMLLTGVAFINAPLGRAVAPEVSVPTEFLVMVALLFLAKRRGAPHRPFLVGIVAYLAFLAVIMAVNPPG